MLFSLLSKHINKLWKCFWFTYFFSLLFGATHISFSLFGYRNLYHLTIMFWKMCVYVSNRQTLDCQNAYRTTNRNASHVSDYTICMKCVHGYALEIYDNRIILWVHYEVRMTIIKFRSKCGHVFFCCCCCYSRIQSLFISSLTTLACVCNLS